MSDIKNCPKLNFPPLRFRVSEEGGRLRVWDGIRGCWLVLTPEEWVRRHLVGLLTEHLGVPPQLIAQEYPVQVQGMPQRADVVVSGRDGRPLLLAECKAPEVAIDAAVYAQAVRYNAVLGARFIMLTNGLKHYVYELVAGGGYVKSETFPQLADLL